MAADGKKRAEAMRAFYARVDAAAGAACAERGVACRGCGECCRFDTAEHILYASTLEREYLLGVVAAGGAFPENPDGTAELLAAGKRCPFQAGGRCFARAGRVLGCRLHFCGWGDGAGFMEFAENWHAELKALHAALDAEWEYRPLLPLGSDL